VVRCANIIIQEQLDAYALFMVEALENVSTLLHDSKWYQIIANVCTYVHTQWAMFSGISQLPAAKSIVT
jgi:hypothetical protein